MSYVAAAVGGVSLITGGIQAISGASKARKAQKALEQLQTPTYQASKPINDYYNTALSRFNTSPYNSQLYQNQQKNANAATAQGLSALQDKRSAIGGISRLSALNDKAMLNAGVAAEQQRNQEFNQLGAATAQKSADDKYGFQINRMMPYQKQLQLLGMKAGAGAAEENAGFSNIWSGLNSGASLLSSQYGGKSGGGMGGGNSYGALSAMSQINPY